MNGKIILASVLNPSTDTNCFNGRRLGSNLMPQDLYRIFRSMGRRNLAFQEYVVEKEWVCGDDQRSNMELFFNSNFGSTHGDMKCLYHGENIGSPYRRYVAADVPSYDVAHPLTLRGLFAEVRSTIKSNCYPKPQISDSIVDEGESLEFDITLNRPPTEKITYYYATYPQTATGDFIAHRPTELIFNPGQESTSITVETIPDTHDESNESFYIYITDVKSKLTPNVPTDYLAKAIGTIRDDDGGLTPTPSISSQIGNEGESLVFTVGSTAHRPEARFTTTRPIRRRRVPETTADTERPR